MTYYKNDGSEHGNDRFSFKDTDNTVEYLVNVTVNLINDPPSFAKADKVRDPLMVPLGRPILELPDSLSGLVDGLLGSELVRGSLNKVFKPIIGYSNLLTTEYIPLSDDDTPSEYVKVNILGRYKPPPNQEHTYFYNKNQPEKEIQSFKLSELENEEIYLYQA